MLPTVRKRALHNSFPSVLFDQSPFEDLARVFHNTTPQHQLSSDVKEYEDRYELVFDVPGVDRENIDITLEERELSVTVERLEEHREEQGTTLQSGRWYGSTSRRFQLPFACSEDAIEARLKDGVLTLTVQKQEDKQSKKILIS